MNWMRGKNRTTAVFWWLVILVVLRRHLKVNNSLNLLAIVVCFKTNTRRPKYITIFDSFLSIRKGVVWHLQSRPDRVFDTKTISFGLMWRLDIDWYESVNGSQVCLIFNSFSYGICCILQQKNTHLKTRNSFDPTN